MNLTESSRRGKGELDVKRCVVPARTKYSAEFKREPVEITLVEGVTLTQIATEWDIRTHVLGR